jgi:hypothetical protein
MLTLNDFWTSLTVLLVPWYWLMQVRTIRETIELECYMDGAVIGGPISCPAERRLIDIFNSAVDGSGGDFIRLLGVTDGERIEARHHEVFVRKSAIDFAAVAVPDAGRGAGANPGRRQYPFVIKDPVRVSLRLPTFVLTGELHCSRGQTMEGVLNTDARFLPLTAVTMIRDHRYDGSRPFVAVNRERIAWSMIEPPLDGGPTGRPE